MYWKWIAGIAGVCGIVFIVIAVMFSSIPHEAHVSQIQAQMLMDYEIPHLKEMHGVRATHGEIKFHDTADLRIEIKGHKLGKQFTMVVSAVGQPDITHARNGELHFKAERVKIEAFEYSGTGPGDLLKRGAERYLHKHEGLQTAVLDAAPHIEQWMTAMAENAAVLFLQHVPVYKLKDDWKGTFIGASIVQAKVIGDHLEITYSLLALTSQVMIWFAMGVVFVIVCLVFIFIEI